MPPPTHQASPDALALTSAVWLARLDLGRYAANFREHLTVADLACALYPDKVDDAAAARADTQLREQYGVTALGARRKITASLQQWAPSILFSSPPKPKEVEGTKSRFTKAAGGQMLFRSLSGAPPKVPPLGTKRTRSEPITGNRKSKLVIPGGETKPNGDGMMPSSTQMNAQSNTNTSTTDGKTDENKRPLWPIFEKGYRAPASAQKRPRISSMLTTPKSGQRSFVASGATGASSNGASVNAGVGAASSRRGATRGRGGRGGGGGRSGGPGGGRRYHLACHRVPGTGFVIDSFKVPRDQNDATGHFLTHMHADHYGGLSRRSLPEGAVVYCTATTASLARKIISLPEHLLHVIPLGVPIDIACSSAPGRGATVYAYDANHCPGAAILLFRVWATNEWVLHSGDCRWHHGIFCSHPQLADVVARGALSTLYLDTTYAGEAHDFPSQSSVLSSVSDAARAEDERTRKRARFFIGSYTIGKERVVQAVVQALGPNELIFAEARKRRILKAADLGSDFERRLTDVASSARVFVVPMGALKPDGIREFARRNKLDDSFIGRALAVAVRPTGWSYRPGSNPVRKSIRKADNAVVLDVAYSEHSSLSELKQFVQWANPKRIIPTVGFHSEEKRAALVQLLRSPSPHSNPPET